MHAKWKVTAGVRIIREGRFFWENWICRNRKDATLATFRITCEVKMSLWSDGIIASRGSSCTRQKHSRHGLASWTDRWVSVWDATSETSRQVLCPSKFNQYDVLHSRKGRLQEEVNYPTAKGIIRLELALDTSWLSGPRWFVRHDPACFMVCIYSSKRLKHFTTLNSSSTPLFLCGLVITSLSADTVKTCWKGWK